RELPEAKAAFVAHKCRTSGLLVGALLAGRIRPLSCTKQRQSWSFLQFAGQKRPVSHRSQRETGPLASGRILPEDLAAHSAEIRERPPDKLVGVSRIPRFCRIALVSVRTPFREIFPRAGWPRRHFRLVPACMAVQLHSAVAA